MRRRRRNRIAKVLRAAQHGRCAYCQRRLTTSTRPGGRPYWNTETIEHLQRRAEGGTDRLENLALVCYECNSLRGSMPWVLFATIRQRHVRSLERMLAYCNGWRPG
ncbi:HNH endonuclease [Pelagibacterium sp. H642]|uniref:HNH endonuclease n=1 Tax=Pelagibacterium sp. H642 TaxID=1881069 RepID=UPI0035C0F16D